MASGIPKYGTWEDGDTDGFTIQFEKVRTFKKDGPKMTLNDLNQDLGPTQPPETIKANEEGRVKNSVEAPVKPQEVKLDELNAKKSTLHHPAGVEVKGKTGKPRRNSPPDVSPNVSPPVPEFGDWNESQNFTDIFKRNEKGSGFVKPGPISFSPEKPKPSKKGGFCGCCFP